MPGSPPYGGAHADVVPHLTVADSDDPAVLEHVGAAVAPLLPVTTRVSAVELWTDGDDGRWRERWRFPLAV